MNYLYLAIAIVAEVAATSALKAAAGFTRLWPSVVVVIGYATAFYFLGQVLKTMPVGIVYAIWSGMGIVLVTVFGMVIYREAPDWPAVVGMSLIIVGVAIINLFSRMVGH